MIATGNPIEMAIICNIVPPYREYFHMRVAREIPEARLWTVCTHEKARGRWESEPPEEIRPVSFGKGQSPSEKRVTGIWREWVKGRKITRWMERQGIRFVVINGYNDTGRLHIIRWCKQRSIPCFLWGDSNIRDDTAEGIKAWIKKKVVTRIVTSCSGVLPCGQLGRAFFEKYGVDPDKVFYCPCEPDGGLIRDVPDTLLKEVQERFGLIDPNDPKERRRFVYSGRLAPEKRVDLLIDAFVNIADARPDWDLLLVGDGPLHQSLKDSVPERYKDRVIWTGFLDDQAVVSALYRVSDILVLPSDYEPWALVVIEGAIAGLGIVTSSVVGAAYELVREGVNGMNFPPGDGEALKRCLLEVSDPTRLDSIKRGSGIVLEDWKRDFDPIDGLRKAMRSVGVLPGG